MSKLSMLRKQCNLEMNVVASKLAILKKNKETYDSLMEAKEKIMEVSSDIETILSVYNLFLAVLANEDNAFKEKRLRYLEAYIDRNLEIIFPNEGFRSKIDFDYSYKKQKVALYLVDRYNKVRIPSICEGSLLQQLIGFSAAVGIVECMGANKLYMDEAFSASSMENLTKISALLKKLIDDDFQILIIEQKNDIFKDLPRREINLEKDAIEECAKVVEIIDY